MISTALRRVLAGLGAVTVVLTSACGGGTSTSSNSPAPQAPQVTQQPAALTVAPGQPARFSVAASGTAPLTYQWQRDGVAIAGATATSFTLAAAAAADNGARFRVVVSNAAGSVISDAAQLTVSQVAVAPSITTQPVPSSVTAGSPATFSVGATGTAPLAYQWRRNGVDIAGATSATYTLAASVPADDGVLFSVVVSNAVGSLVSSSARMTVTPAAIAPVITFQPQGATVVVGGTAAFTVAASGTAPLSYQWRRNTVAIAGATAATYTTGALVTADSGASFTAVVSNPAGSVTSAAAVVTVAATAIAPTITTQPASLTLDAGQTATFSVTASGTAPLGYQWRRDGVDIAGATASTFTTAPVAAADNGARYTVAVGNAAGTVFSTAAIVTVTPATWIGVLQDGSDRYDDGYAVASDATGNVFVSGRSSTAAGLIYDVTVAKYAPNRTRLWMKTFPLNTPDTSRALALDAGGNALVGWHTHNSSGNNFGRVTKLDTNGTPIWEVRIDPLSQPSDGSVDVTVMSMTVASSGNILVAGTVDYNGRIPNPGILVYVAGLTPGGGQLWFKTFKSTSNARDVGIAVDEADMAYLGYTRYLDSSEVWPAEQPGDAMAVVKLTPAGDTAWARWYRCDTAAGTSVGCWDRVRGVAVNRAGNRIYVVGDTDRNFVTPPINSGGIYHDIVLLQLDGSGNRNWVAQLGSTRAGGLPGDDFGLAVTTDAAGSAAWITGYTTQGNFEGSGMTGDGWTDSVVARYSADGTRTWIHQIRSGVAGNTINVTEMAYAITRDANDDVYVVGTTEGYFSEPSPTRAPDWFVMKLKGSDGTPY